MPRLEQGLQQCYFPKTDNSLPSIADLFGPPSQYGLEQQFVGQDKVNPFSMRFQYRLWHSLKDTLINMGLSNNEIKSTLLDKEFPSKLQRTLDEWVTTDKYNLSKFFDIGFEIKKADELRARGLSNKEVDFFLKEQVLRFILEFGAEVGFTKITEKFNDGVLSSAGLDVLEHYKAARNMPLDSRAYNEFKGVENVVRGFSNGATVAVVLSPPWIGDYSFAFVFSRQGTKVTEYLVKYNEKRGVLKQSQAIRDRLEYLGLQSNGNYANTNDFVSKPFVGNVPPSDIISAIGVTKEEIMRSMEIEFIYKQILSPLIEKYITEVKSGYAQAASSTITLIYLLSKQLKFSFDRLRVGTDKSIPSQGINSADVNSLGTVTSLNAVSAISGGSCPVLKNFLDLEAPSLSSISSSMQVNGDVISPHKTESDDNTVVVICPKCGNTVSVNRSKVAETHTVVCPHCHYEVKGCKADLIIGEQMH